MDKRTKECIKYYLENIDSAQYKEAKIKSDIDRKRAHWDYINNEKPQWKSRTDYYEDLDRSITQVIVIDVLSNEGVSMLIKKLYSLPKKKFKVQNYYKKPSLTKKYDYIHLQYSHSKMGIFAEIKLLDDKYLSDISISWSQINNYYAAMEYTFSFKRRLNEERYLSFMRDNIKKLSSKDYTIWYSMNEGNKETPDVLMLTQMNNEYFPLLIQHYITSYLYTEQGKDYPLINIVFFTRKDSIDINKLYLEDFGVSYHNKTNNYVICSDYDGINYSLFAGNNSIPCFSIMGYITNYGNDYYYRFCGIREIKIFEIEFSKYSTGRKSVSFNKEFKRLLNKTQSITEYKYLLKDDMYKQFNQNWSFYKSNDKTSLKDYHNKVRKINCQKIYKDNFSYLNILSEINNVKSNRLISLVAIIISVIAIIVSIVVT